MDPAQSEANNMLAGRFAGWRLPVDGLVARPGRLSLSFLKAMPSRTQVTQQSCEDGWPAIAEWTGAQLSRVLESAGFPWYAGI